MPEAKQTVFVVDDDDALRDAIATLLDAEGQPCETYPDAASLLARFADLPPEVSGCLVLDVRMPGLSGLDAVRAMKGGAVDFLSKPLQRRKPSPSAREALRADAERHTVRNELAAIQARTAKLTPREREVLERVAAGQANKRVAIDLGVSERTVEIHRSHLMQKMGARHLADLVRMKLLLDRG